ncbi:DUF167 domain-containing protein [Candidatus Saccharibacteria bacterium]|nr:DUF167 domain-containing protein [Candidatus Saccharibacteria bacterium]
MKISVLVRPGSKKGPLIEAAPFDGGVSDGLIVYLREKAHDGEANEALVKMLADYYGVSKSCVEIVRGQKSHQKLVEIIK